MDLYTFSLTLGAAGLLFMAFLGLSHSHSGGQAGHGHSGHGGHGHSGHGGHEHSGHAGHGHTGHAGHGHASHAGHGNAGHSGDDHSSQGNPFLALLSPRVIFSFLLGFGTAGVVLHPFASGAVLLTAAIAGGLAFERLLVNPLWNFMFRFASAPALTLESAVEDEAKAVTNFDKNGCGLIAVEVDGRVLQVLGTLNKT